MKRISKHNKRGKTKSFQENFEYYFLGNQMQNLRERERLLGFRVFQRVTWEPLSALVETRAERTKVSSYFLFLDQFFIFSDTKQGKKLLGGDGGHIRCHRPSQIVRKKRRQITTEI